MTPEGEREREMSYRFQITLSDEAYEIIESLIATGMYGRTASEVIKSLVFEHLRGEDNLLSAIFQKAYKRAKVKVNRL